MLTIMGFLGGERQKKIKKKIFKIPTIKKGDHIEICISMHNEKNNNKKETREITRMPGKRISTKRKEIRGN